MVKSELKFGVFRGEVYGKRELTPNANMGLQTTASNESRGGGNDRGDRRNDRRGRGEDDKGKSGGGPGGRGKGNSAGGGQNRGGKR